MRQIRITCPSSQGGVWFDNYIDQYFFVHNHLSVDGCYVINKVGVKRVHKQHPSYRKWPRLYVSIWNAALITAYHNDRGIRQVRKL